jgi:hypothetical protein
MNAGGICVENTIIVLVKYGTGGANPKNQKVLKHLLIDRVEGRGSACPFQPGI